MTDATDTQKDTKLDLMAASDVIVSILLIVISLWVANESWKMPRPEGWIRSPGLLPFFIGICLFCMGLGLLISSILKKGPSTLSTTLRNFSLRQSLSSSLKAQRTLWIMSITAFYKFVLLGRMPFEIASFIFLIITFNIFWKKAGWRRILLVSAIVPFFFSALFRVWFETLMPGGSISGLVYGRLLYFFK